MNYFPFHVGDYAAATGHLSWDEDMAYTRLLRAYYLTEKPIPKDQVYRFARAITPAQKKAVDSVLIEFFTLENETYTQSRCNDVIAKFKDKQWKAKRSAESRWETQDQTTDGNAKAMRTHSESIAMAMRTHSDGNANQNQNQNQNQKPKNPTPTGFESFYAKYPKHVGRPAAERAFRSAKINGELPNLLLDIEQRLASGEWTEEKKQFIPNPATYLNQRRWEDEPSAKPNQFAGAI